MSGKDGMKLVIKELWKTVNKVIHVYYAKDNCLLFLIQDILK